MQVLIKVSIFVQVSNILQASALLAAGVEDCDAEEFNKTIRVEQIFLR